MGELPYRIVIGLDDSTASRAAHRWAAAYAHATGTDLCAVHVLDWPIGLSALALKSGTRLCVPKQDVAESGGSGGPRSASRGRATEPDE